MTAGQIISAQVILRAIDPARMTRFDRSRQTELDVLNVTG
jgi:hypothetical protein